MNEEMDRFHLAKEKLNWVRPFLALTQSSILYHFALKQEDLFPACCFTSVSK